MKQHIAVRATVGLTLIACGEPVSPPTATTPRANMTQQDARGAVTTVCHRIEGATRFKPIAVVDAAIGAHLRHGDGVVGGPVSGVPGMAFGDDCVPTGTLFDNGFSSGPQVNYANTLGTQELFEDFTLGRRAVVNAVRWQQHDHNQATYLDTELVIFGGLPYDGPPLFRATLVAGRTPNGTGSLFGAWEGFDYVVDGLAIELPPGTYWIGANARFVGTRSGWDNTVVGPHSIPGFRVINVNYPAPGHVLDGNLAFSLHGRLPWESR